ncbi:hypothetical protein [Clostridium cibarium]|uniref:DUF3899 domain-containing protein n=1 Tax=Clostridium cibarium TaxID=2762247 RepID=A0ABR8PQ81_9CLOT|nr:hypothetical protein [Clostridium cibarium]MBD7910331.1 hypothetical protein [Clostridium cibarium]
MNGDNLITICKCFILSICICVLTIIIGMIINYIKKYAFVDILFMEGIILTIIGVFSCIGTGSTGLYFKANSNSNTQFTTTDTSGKTKYERDVSSIRNILPLSILKFSLILSGILTCTISFIF